MTLVITLFTQAAILIQRMVRGFIARRTYRQLKIDTQRTHAAVVIQKTYRGYHARTHAIAARERGVSFGTVNRLSDERRGELQARVKSWRDQNGRANRPRAEVEQLLHEVRLTVMQD